MQLVGRRPSISDAGNQSGCQCRTHARYIIEPPACFTGSVPGHDHTIELKDLRLQRLQLGVESGDAGAGYLRQPLVACIGDDPKQLLDTMAPDRCNDPELRKVSADDIDYRGLLADEQVTGTVQRQAALLLRRFGRDEPHVRPSDRLTDRFGIGGVVLMPLYIRLHVRRRHQPNSVAKRMEFPRPACQVEEPSTASKADYGCGAGVFSASVIFSNIFFSSSRLIFPN